MQDIMVSSEKVMSVHVSKEVCTNNLDAVLDTTELPTKMHGRIDQPIVVSIGTSNDEEEIQMITDCAACDDEVVKAETDVNIALENRNDDESMYEYDERTSRAAPSVSRVDNSASEDILDAPGNDTTHTDDPGVTVVNQESGHHEARDDGSDNDAGTKRVKFGAHMVRDSVITNESICNKEIGADTATAIDLIEDSDETETNYQSCIQNTVTDNNETKSIHLIGLVSDENESEQISDGSNIQKAQRPLKSILKKSDPLQPDPRAKNATETRFGMFTKRKFPSLSPKLTSLTRYHRASTVTFSSITLRTYDIVLGDHPNCKFGAPISLGWDYHQCDIISVNSYEDARGERRPMKKLYLNSGTRRKLLKRSGFSVEEISEAINIIQEVQLQRRDSADDDESTRYSYNPDQRLGMKGWRTSRKSPWRRARDLFPLVKNRARRQGKF